MKKSMRFAAYEVREAIPLGDAFPKEPPKESFGPSGRQKTQSHEGMKVKNYGCHYHQRLRSRFA